MAELEDVAGEELARVARAAAEFVRRARPPLVRIVSHHDVDGLCAGAITTMACLREGLRAHTSFTANLGPAEVEALGSGSWDVLITSDMGSGQAEELAALDRPVIILDHHIKQGGPRPDHVLELNANDFGLVGASDVSGASMALLFALAMDEANWDLSPLALLGAYGDMQHVGGMRGVNAAVEEEAVRRRLVERRRVLVLSGPTIEEALLVTTDPFFRGLSGRREAVRGLLGRLGIDGSKPLEALTDRENRSLGSYLIVLLGREGVESSFAEKVVADRLLWRQRGVWLDEFSNEVNAAGRLDMTGVGAGACLGDPDHVTTCRAARDDFRNQIRKGLLALEDRAPDRLEHIQWFEPPAAHIAGSLAGLGMIYLFPKDAPVVSVFPKNGSLSVSARTTNAMVERGVDMAKAMETAAGEAGGRGGGHPVAAGASVPTEMRESFLARVDELVGEQLSAGAG